MGTPTGEGPCERANGIYHSDDTCDEFVTCRNNHPIYEKCADGLVFDTVQKTCAWADEALDRDACRKTCSDLFVPTRRRRRRSSRSRQSVSALGITTGMPMRVIAGFSSCASPQDIPEELVAEAARCLTATPVCAGSPRTCPNVQTIMAPLKTSEL